MSIIGKSVKHRTMGSGTITELVNGRITVVFGSKTSRFVYPDAFSAFLFTDDAELSSDIQCALEKKKALEEEKAAEAARLAELERIRIEEEQKSKQAAKTSGNRLHRPPQTKKNDTIALAVGATYDMVLTYGVTAFPACAPYPSGDYSYMIPIKKGGIMEYVFYVQHVVECIPDELESNIGQLDADQARRLLGYHKTRLESFGYNHNGNGNCPYRFYICSEEAAIEQPFERKYIQISCGFQFAQIPLVGRTTLSEVKPNWETADGAWITPCNPNFYDAIGAFTEFDRITWKQSTNVVVGDIVYIYIGTPIQAIRFKCQAERVDVPSDEIDDSKYVLDGTNFEQYGRYMEIVLLDKLDGDEWSLTSLKEHGLTGNLQGPRRITGELAAYIDSISYGAQR